MTRDMRVLALKADSGGCAFYRMEEPARVVREQFNVDIEVGNKLPVDASFDRHGNCNVHKIKTDVDVLIVQRPLLGAFVPAFKACQEKGIACIVELDDDFHAISPDNVAWRNVQPQYSPLANKEKLAQACAIADHVIVSTPALARRYGSHGRVSVLRNYVPKSIFTEFDQKKMPDNPRVGWSGTLQTHPWDLDVAGGHVGLALSRWGTEFNVVGDGKGVRDKLRIPHRTKMHATGWVPRTEYFDAMANSMDIGIVPLELTQFNQGKSWLKGLEMAALGIPFIASPTDEYRKLAMMGIGTIATKGSEWQKSLKQLLTNRDYLIERSETCRELAKTMVYENHAEEWLGAWLAAIKHRKQNPL